jgi:predicted DsbA family dithiol-disulfide isomerase
MRMVNTYRAHQLLHWAGIGEGQTALKLALFESFFSRRENVNDTGVLVDAVIRAGLDSGEARAVLADARYAGIVREEEQYWREQEVYAVPMFVFQGQYPVPGAQEAETFIRVLQKIRLRAA